VVEHDFFDEKKNWGRLGSFQDFPRSPEKSNNLNGMTKIKKFAMSLAVAP
jgi:hypothetical protein